MMKYKNYISLHRVHGHKEALCVSIRENGWRIIYFYMLHQVNLLRFRCLQKYLKMVVE